MHTPYVSIEAIISKFEFWMACLYAWNVFLRNHDVIFKPNKLLSFSSTELGSFTFSQNFIAYNMIRVTKYQATTDFFNMKKN